MRSCPQGTSSPRSWPRGLHLCWTVCLQAIYVPADDLTDPAPATTFAHLDATTVLSRGIAELGIYPAVDPLDSTSRILDPNIVGQQHYEVARGVQKILQASALRFLVYLQSLTYFDVVAFDPWETRLRIDFLRCFWFGDPDGTPEK